MSVIEGNEIVVVNPPAKWRAVANIIDIFRRADDTLTVKVKKELLDAIDYISVHHNNIKGVVGCWPTDPSDFRCYLHLFLVMGKRNVFHSLPFLTVISNERSQLIKYADKVKMHYHICKELTTESAIEILEELEKQRIAATP